MKLRFLSNNQAVNLEASKSADGGLSVTLPDGVSHNIDIRVEKDGCVDFDLQEADAISPKRYSLPVAHTDRGIEISYLVHTYVFNEPRTERGTAKREISSNSGSLTAPMVGVLSDLFVAEGEQVAAYQALAVVEAMKVMATIEAPFAGTVTRIYAKKGAQLAHGAAIIDLVPIELK